MPRRTGTALSLEMARFNREEAASRQVSESSGQESETWSFTSPIFLQNMPVPERKFIVEDWIAPGHVTINFGDGGVGKTLLAQQLMTSCATGKPWCGLAVNRCKAIGLFCEDDEDELHRRQHAINLAYGVDFSDLQDTTWASGVGIDNTLLEFDADARARVTAGFATLKAKAESFKSGLIVVDTAADTFGGNENARREVRQFIGVALGKMAKELNAAVLLNAHPSRSGLSKDGDVDGGSTAWNNTARARWSLTRPKSEGDEQVDPDTRILTRRKANYASIGDTIKLRWNKGVLVPIEQPGRFSAMANASKTDSVFLELLEKVGAEGRPASPSRNSSNWAPKLFAAHAGRQGFGRGEFTSAMERLFAAGRIRVEEYGRDNGRGKPRRIVVTGGVADV